MNSKVTNAKQMLIALDARGTFKPYIPQQRIAMSLVKAGYAEITSKNGWHFTIKITELGKQKLNELYPMYTC